MDNRARTSSRNNVSPSAEAVVTGRGDEDSVNAAAMKLLKDDAVPRPSLRAGLLGEALGDLVQPVDAQPWHASSLVLRRLANPVRLFFGVDSLPHGHMVPVELVTR